MRTIIVLPSTLRTAQLIVHCVELRQSFAMFELPRKLLIFAHKLHACRVHHLQQCIVRSMRHCLAIGLIALLFSRRKRMLSPISLHFPVHVKQPTMNDKVRQQTPLDTSQVRGIRVAVRLNRFEPGHNTLKNHLLVVDAHELSNVLRTAHIEHQIEGFTARLKLLPKLRYGRVTTLVWVCFFRCCRSRLALWSARHGTTTATTATTTTTTTTTATTTSTPSSASSSSTTSSSTTTTTTTSFLQFLISARLRRHKRFRCRSTFLTNTNIRIQNRVVPSFTQCIVLLLKRRRKIRLVATLGVTLIAAIRRQSNMLRLAAIKREYILRRRSIEHVLHQLVKCLLHERLTLLRRRQTAIVSPPHALVAFRLAQRGKTQAPIAIVIERESHQLHHERIVSLPEQTLMLPNEIRNGNEPANLEFARLLILRALLFALRIRGVITAVLDMRTSQRQSQNRFRGPHRGRMLQQLVPARLDRFHSLTASLLRRRRLLLLHGPRISNALRVLLGQRQAVKTPVAQPILGALICGHHLLLQLAHNQSRLKLTASIPIQMRRRQNIATFGRDSQNNLRRTTVHEFRHKISAKRFEHIVYHTIQHVGTSVGQQLSQDIFLHKRHRVEHQLLEHRSIFLLLDVVYDTKFLEHDTLRVGNLFLNEIRAHVRRDRSQ
mmetsp:Transcript_16399/g.25267  ORF Transcript_16399/g.25267 Transcript_16399/m.25267 type:complete len:661 (-) Transcript_16399:521-2503(-)